MVLRKLAVALLSVGVMLPGLGHALAVSDLKTKSALGEPFWGEVELSEINDLNADEIKVSLATQEDFERVGVERVYFLTDLKFDVIVNPAGRSYVKITTVKPVREPYLDFVVRVAWPGNASLRELTALLDPPVGTADTAPADINQAVSSAPADAAPVAAPLPEVAAAPDTTVAAPADAAPPAPAPVFTPAPVAQSPKKSPAATPSPVPSVAADSYRTQSGDTMSKIASQFRPADASSAQTMVAIQRANPSAFGNGNINQLKRGQVLRIPSESEIREVSAREAVASVREQSEAWRGAAASAPAKPALEAQQVDATAKAEVKAPAAPAEVKPEMKLLGAQAGKNGAAATGKEQGVAAKPGDARKLDENKAKLETAKAEKDKLNSKVSTLDSQVKANDKKLDVQNAKLAELQAQVKEQEAKKAAAAAAPAAKTPAPGAAPAPEVAAAPAAAPAATPDAAAPAATPDGVQTQAAEPAAPIESKPLPPAPKPAVVAEEAPAPEGLPIPLIGGGIAALLAVLGGLWWNQKRKRDKAEEDAALAELEAMDSLPDTGSDAPDALLFGGSNIDAPLAAPAQDDSWLGEFEAAESAPAAQDRVLADPLEEVEQYLAFERYPQAVGFLNKAISGSPERADLRLKLLEVYARLDDWNGFTEQEAWFENAGDLGALAHAEELKAGMTPPARKASPDDPLHYERAAPVAAAAVSASDDLPSLEDLEMDFNATVSASSPALQAVQDSDLSLDLPDLDSDFTLETPKLDIAPVKAADSGLSLDEDLDFSYSEPATKAPAAVADDLSFELDDTAFESTAKLEPETTAADEALDFSLDESFDAPASTGGKSSLGELVDFDSAPEIKAIDPANSVAEDDLSFSLDDLETASAPSADLDGDFSLDDVSKSSANLSFDDTLQADSGLNDAVADFDSTLRAETAPAAAVSAAPAAAAADLGMDDEFDFLADTDENATKLDLARAYIDMGDMDGARDILQEVLSEGNGNQKDEAKGLLAQVG
ncbi:MAG: FimV/HubP family polar landmark protein [Pedobacter sp.]|nr:FimV/HubP family polar landmark protein [Pedobacter sp.]